jgi:hypothetical protein
LFSKSFPFDRIGLSNVVIICIFALVFVVSGPASTSRGRLLGGSALPACMVVVVVDELVMGEMEGRRIVAYHGSSHWSLFPQMQLRRCYCSFACCEESVLEAFWKLFVIGGWQNQRQSPVDAFLYVCVRCEATPVFFAYS